MSHRRLARIAAAAGAGCLVLGSQILLSTTPAGASGLTTYGDCDEFLAQQRADLRARATEYGIEGTGLMLDYRREGGPDFAVLQSVTTLAKATDSQAQGASSETGTNLQEAGVDEPDTAKLADGRIVVVTNNSLKVLSSGRTPKVLGSLDLSAAFSSVTELLLVGDRALIIGATTRPFTPKPMPSPAPTVPAPSMPTPAPSAPGTASPTPLPSTPTTSPSEPMPTPTPGSSSEASSAVPAPTTVLPPSPAAASPEDAVERKVASGPDTWQREIVATRVMLIELGRGAPQVLEERLQDGAYISARLVEGTVRLVTRSLPAVRGVMPEQTGVAIAPAPGAADQTSPLATPEQAAWLENRRIAESAPLSAFLPQFSRADARGTTVEAGAAVSCKDTAHAPDGLTGGMVTVTTMRPGQDLAALDSDAVATSADTVYAATDRLYISTSRWPVPQLATAGSVALSGVAARTEAVTTEIHAFDTSQQEATDYVASGSVPGYLLGRWALSRFEGTLRAATTSDPGTGGPDVQTESMVVKLTEQGDELVETGRVEGLGKGERITAVRYFGDLASVVTFRQTDPLYLVDLSGSPKVTGELKIPGYSTYLHPIGDDLLLGIGYDADESGTVTGMQASTFDISDRSAPRLVDRLPVSVPGAGQQAEVMTPAIDDSRAFTYDPDRRVLLLPLTVFDWNASDAPTGYVSGIRVDDVGRLTATDALEVSTSGVGTPERVLLDGDWFHAIGRLGVATADADSLEASGQATWTAAP
jgi:uncharacterized secreted protein with C-terminal beta-propeller domain